MKRGKPRPSTHTATSRRYRLSRQHGSLLRRTESPPRTPFRRGSFSFLAKWRHRERPRTYRIGALLLSVSCVEPEGATHSGGQPLPAFHEGCKQGTPQHAARNMHRAVHLLARTPLHAVPVLRWGLFHCFAPGCLTRLVGFIAVSAGLPLPVLRAVPSHFRIAGKRNPDPVKDRGSMVMQPKPAGLRLCRVRIHAGVRSSSHVLRRAARKSALRSWTAGTLPTPP